jgi:hypothetical protein
VDIHTAADSILIVDWVWEHQLKGVHPSPITRVPSIVLSYCKKNKNIWLGLQRNEFQFHLFYVLNDSEAV